MTPDEFRRRREALGLSHHTFANRLGVTAADVIRCERSPQLHPFVLTLAIAYVELQLEARRRHWPAAASAAAIGAQL